MRFVAGLILCLLLATPARAWLDGGHMAIARMAWLRLTQQERDAATKILKQHPHYDEFLKAQRPPEASEEEWAFLRASIWPDWVRNTHADEFNKPTWHYIEMRYVPGYSRLSLPETPAKAPNAVTQIDWAVEQLRGEDAAIKPIALCWLLHLIGDIHQPNHAITLFSEEFPEGDKGGNLGLIRVENADPIRIHLYWDGLLGQYASWPTILELDAALEATQKTDADEIKRQLSEHTSAMSWAEESYAAGKKHAYLDGTLHPANSDLHPREDNIPHLTAEYAKEAGDAAKVRATLAAIRTADTLSTALGEKLN